MRRWELVGDGSAKFWEVEHDGVAVTVRFGLIGSPGRSKTTAFDSGAAASAQVDELVAAKEKKGYRAAPDQPAEPEPPAARPFETDQPVFTVPESWVPHVHERRGGRVRRTPVVEPDAAERVRAALTASMADLEEVFADPSSEGRLVDAARAYLAGAETPLGAAAIAALMEEIPETREALPLLVPAWLRAHGLSFAARAAVEAFSVQVYREQHPERRHVLWHAPPEGRRGCPSWPATEVMRQVRSSLAAASDADHETAVSAVEPLRTGVRSLLATAYLMPTARNWVDEAFAEVERVGAPNIKSVLMFSLGSVAQLDRAIERHGLWWCLRRKEVAFTIADVIGPDLAPTLVPILRPSLEGDFRELILKVVVEFPTAEAFDLLLARLDDKQVPQAVLDLAHRYPVLALERFATTGGKMLRHHLKRHPDLADRVELPEEARAFVEGLRAARAAVEEAPVAALPAILVDPPWAVRRKPVKPVVVKGLTAPDHRAVEWAPGEQAAWAEVTFPHHLGDVVWEDEIEAYRTGGRMRCGDDVLFFAGPVEALRPLVSEWRPNVTWYSGLMGQAVLARFGVDALPVALHLAPNRTDEMEDLIRPLVSLETARLVANWLVRPKAARGAAVAWLRRHPLHAARFLVPDALGPAGRRRTVAEVALRLIPEQAREASGEYGPEAERAIDQFLSVDPLSLLPKTIPTRGEWAAPTLLPPVLLRGTTLALPPKSVHHLLTVLALSTPDGVYAGVGIVREACDRTSLARFAWELFEMWQVHGMPSEDDWVLTALGLLGDDEVVRGLTPLIRAWPGQVQHKRAVAGLDVLAAIGTDTALGALNSIAQRVRFAGLRDRARAKVGELAAELGLTAEQLSDRLVPDFGLDDAATLTIDYGPRTFTVGFDEQLKPFVLDQDGRPLKDLPKPGARDDRDRASAEHKRFGQLKKDVRTIAGDQVARLEQAMVVRRRWPAAEFRALLAGHPLLRHLVRRLVWTTQDGRSFRVAEDGTLADVHDDGFEVPEDGSVGVAHPVHLGDEVEAWARVFADYEIVQPFPQLGRPVFRLEPAERSSTALDRFKGIEVPVGRLLGLTKRGWERGTPQDAGIEHEITRPLPDGGSIEVTLAPGIEIGNPQYSADQTFRAVDLCSSGGRTFGDLDPVTVSEVLAELTGLED